MSLFGLIFVLVVIGVVLYLIETYIPMAPPIKLILRIVVVALVILWLLQIFNVAGPSVPRLH